ncbi:hypothetical protein B0A50_01144 [Salinomyces thailandicus]|uniref:Uncharacterized protein n=1 Tax=Salinomyces thailandicus TaxID=706561 RepID=A0A4U0UBZ3_9PEZI|nr:hypothetical protein B0A50_01144 [Salinomyces thailandica]
MAEEQNTGTGSLRPESTLVQNFSADLDSMFGLGEGPAVGQLAENVQQKQQTVTTASTELEKLEAKLRETEQRLAQARGDSPSRAQANSGAPRSSSNSAEPTTNTTNHAGASQTPAQHQQTHAADWPPAGGRPQPSREDTKTLMAGMPGALPETPRREYSGSNEYVMVDRGAGRSEQSVG